MVRTGWGDGNTLLLRETIRPLCDQLGVTLRSLEPWVGIHARETGLDVVLFRAFPDGRVGRPIFLGQCASGVTWEQKRKEPDLDLWTEMVQFVNDPQRLFVLPFVLTSDELLRSARLVQGPVLDRVRLLSQPGGEPTDALSDDLVTWICGGMKKLRRHLSGDDN